jgi:ubiquinone/menaquinone biosynthesis C-methylase UbiE
MPETKRYLPEFIQIAIYWVMHLFFHQLYHSFSWAYDLVAATVSAGRWKDWVIETAKLVIGPRVLELGFGPGHLQKHLTACGMAIYGLDESRQMVCRASKTLARQGLPAHLARGMAQNLPFPNLFFDCVTATFPSQYIFDPVTLEEVYRVLKPGGQLVVLMASWITGRSMRERWLALLFRITGEVPGNNQDINQITWPYVKAGFKARLRFVELPGSRLLFIIACKET